MSSILRRNAISETARVNQRNRLLRTWELLAVPIPEDADPRWRDVTYVLQRLLDKVIHHESMTAAAEQQFLDNFDSGSPIICMWEFFATLLDSLRLFPVRLNASPRWNSMYHEYWNKYLRAAERYVRSILGEPEWEHPAWAFIRRTFPHLVRLEPEFGDDIERWAVRLQDAIRAGRVVQSVSTAGRIVQSDSASSSTSSV